MSTMAAPQGGNVSFNMASAVTKKSVGAEHVMTDKVNGVRHVANGKLILRDLNFYYGKFQGLHNINVSFPERQVTAMIGPSGCGKSTLLRTLNRIYDLYPGQRAEGEILMDGQNLLDKSMDVNQLRAKASGKGFCARDEFDHQPFKLSLLAWFRAATHQQHDRVGR